MASTTKTGFWSRDTTPGYLLLAATAVSFLLLNGPLEPAVHHLLEDPFARLAVGDAPALSVNWHIVINDGLMAIFFLYVGLELKRETVEGPFRNPREAVREALLDVQEGADWLMVKPALPYLDVVRAVREASLLPLSAYNVSGEYSAVKAAAANGWLDEARIVRENLLAIRRAGADQIITYHARDALQGNWLK